jgi:hypothetical protein
MDGAAAASSRRAVSAFSVVPGRARLRCGKPRTTFGVSADGDSGDDHDAEAMCATTHPSASFSATLRVHLTNRPGSFALLAEAIGEAGGLLDSIDLVRVEHGKKIRDVSVLASDKGTSIASSGPFARSMGWRSSTSPTARS